MRNGQVPKVERDAEGKRKATLSLECDATEDAEGEYETAARSPISILKPHKQAEPTEK